MFILNILLSIFLVVAFLFFVVKAIKDAKEKKYKRLSTDLTMAGIALCVFFLNHWSSF